MSEVIWDLTDFLFWEFFGIVAMWMSIITVFCWTKIGDTVKVIMK